MPPPEGPGPAPCVGLLTSLPRGPRHGGPAGSGFQALKLGSRSLRTFSMEVAGLQLWLKYCIISTLIGKQPLLHPRYP